MNRLARLAWPLLALSLGTAGCVAAADHEGVATAEAPAEAPAAESPQAHAGVAGLLGESLAALAVRPEQTQAIAQIRADLQGNRAPVQAARRDLALAVADGIAAGNLSEATLAPHVARLTQSVDALAPSIQGAVNKLHVTLDAAQRKALVDDMRARGKARHAGAHEGGPRQRMAKLAGDLALSKDQLDRLHAAVKAQAGGAERGEMMKEHEAMHDRMVALGEAFAGETFDAAALGVGRELGPMANAMASHRLRFVALILPILTPEQRTQLATSVRAKANAAEPSFEE